MKKMIYSLLFLLSFFLFIGNGFSAGTPSVQDECSNELANVVSCLTYATGKSTKPTEQCCSSVKEIRESKPVCLCYLIQQVHKGGANVKSMGLQEDKLLELPTVCKLGAANIEKCPKLLSLSPSDPDNAIFKNSSSPATPAMPGTTPTTPASSAATGKANDGSTGVMLKPHLQVPVVLIAVFVSVFLAGFISMSV